MRFCTLAATVLLAIPLAAHADDITFYTNQNAFGALATTTLSDNFNNGGPEPLTGTYTYQGISYTATGYDSVSDAIVPTYFYIYRDTSGYYNSVASSFASYIGAGPGTRNGPEFLELTFAPTTAIGFVLGDYFGSEALQIATGSTSFQEYLSASGIASGTTVFAGLTSSAPFTSVRITGDNTEIDLIQTFYGGSATSSTPEPSSVVLLGTGLLGVAGVIKRRFA